MNPESKSPLASRFACVVAVKTLDMEKESMWGGGPLHMICVRAVKGNAQHRVWWTVVWAGYAHVNWIQSFWEVGNYKGMGCLEHTHARTHTLKSMHTYFIHTFTNHGCSCLDLIACSWKFCGCIWVYTNTKHSKLKKKKKKANCSWIQLWENSQFKVAGANVPSF